MATSQRKSATTGDFNTRTFRDQAEVTLAALDYLRARDDIRPDRVGLWGHSQGGMIAPLAAAISDKVAFLIEVSGWQGPACQAPGPHFVDGYLTAMSVWLERQVRTRHR